MQRDVPFYEKHYLDMAEDDLMAMSKGKSKSTKRRRQISRVEVGVQETQGMIARHNTFLLRYTEEKHQKKHATWLLGLAACASNDALTHTILEQCMERGLAVDDIAGLGLCSDSSECARFLTAQGVDWVNELVPLPSAQQSYRALDVNSPHTALIDQFFERSAGGQAYVQELASVLIAAAGGLDVQPSRFIKAVLESGTVPADLRLETQALGLVDGKASWISHCICSNKLKLARVGLAHFKQLPQAILDEALLACVMSLSSAHHDEQRKDMAHIIKTLADRGANPDAKFAFGVAAYQDLVGKEFHPHFNKPGKMEASTREWSVYASVKHSLPAAVERIVFPSPWPKPPTGADSWAQLCLNRHSAHLSDARSSEAKFAIKRLLDLPDAPDLPTLFASVDVRVFAPPRAGKDWSALDGVLESKASHRATEKLGHGFVMGLVCGWGGCTQEGLEDVSKALTTVATRLESLWSHPRLDRVLNWMGPDDRVRAKSQINAFVDMFRKYNKQQVNSLADKEAMAMAYTAFLQTANAPQAVPLARRRTL